MVSVFLGMGSNVDPRGQYLDRARHAVSRLPETAIRAKSSVYETSPVGVASDADFWNAVLWLETGMAPETLLAACEQIERELGRHAAAKATGGNRTIDLDLLLYGDLVLRTDRLELPHPRLHERLFTLVPLVDLEPGTRHPVLGKTVVELLHQGSFPGQRIHIARWQWGFHALAPEPE